jgi:hypothetical protein
MKEEEYSHMFLSLVYSLQMQTMIHLGKLPNPATGKTEVELDAAQATIDMIDMLKAKTVNNLNENELRFMDQILADLKLNYVDEKNKPQQQEEQKAAEVDEKEPSGEPKQEN